ncbi:universal stress protein [Kribbella sp. NPDC000426]|uniref:universal stress protein n=1 Tax=Kribbella sp. NPDC000426 TaxID=3154255 RepID=UPI003326334E
MKLFRGGRAASAVPATAVVGPDHGPVIVLVRGSEDSKDAVEWAAAEAAARQSELRIVHAFQWVRVLDPFGHTTVDPRVRESAEKVVEVAERRARRIASGLRVSTIVFPGKPAAALASAAEHGGRQSLLVVGHDQPSGRSWIRRLRRRTPNSVAVVGLTSPYAPGPSAGRVVVGIDRTGGPQPVLGFAFRAARRRGTGLTIVHATSVNRHDDIEDTVRVWQMAYPEVDVRWTVTTGPADSAILAESAAAALTVIGSTTHTWLRRLLHGSTACTVQQLARGPVVAVGPDAV